MTNHIGSAILSLLGAVVAVTVGQVAKADLAGSRLGTVAAGGLGSIVFVFLLTAISNLQMASSGTQAKAGISEVTIALIISLIISATIHRVAFTVCFLFSALFLYLIADISQARYGVPVSQQHSVNVIKKKK
uniref:Dolichyl-diphosphooligosaccharide--protein glycosyltransferase subunit KCP2 n=1 Tax=Syphacia muris TaxID=451379 RepID=A0A0N5AEQ7_9BILA